MSRTENEQEFVLGNRQLLSAFFVVVMLLGVFFAMGYIIGKNSAGDGASKKPAQAEPAPTTSSAPADSTPPPAPQTPAAEPEAPPKRTEAVAAPVVTEPVKHVPEKRAAEKEEPARVESTAAHKYLQVSAVKRPAADSIVKTLKDKGFPALLGESSKPELFRVLVGPYSETEALSKAKTDLKAMGFDAVVSK
jgi:cell division septation protein DedD